MIDKKLFNRLNDRLQSLLNEQLDLDLLTNPLFNWSDNILSKQKLDLKYCGREFDISQSWKDKVIVEKEKKEFGNTNWNEQILNDNEDKRQIFLKLAKRKEELIDIILATIDEIENCMGITDDINTQAELIFQ
jgi:hypothetical protein